MFIKYGGILLVAEDDLKGIHNASIVLLMGSVADRALGAAKLYEDNVGRNIIMVRPYIAANEILQRNGISIADSASNSKLILQKFAVNLNDIVILPGEAKSTKDEAEAIYEFINKANKIDSIVIVTSKYHSFRAKLIFKKIFKHLDIDIYSAPTPYDPFDSKKWYKRRDDSKKVVEEYLKIAYYFLFEQFNIK